MGPKVGTNLTPFSYLSLKAEGIDGKFEPGKLPDAELEQLWEIAARKDKIELCRTIEEELMKRRTKTKI